MAINMAAATSIVGATDLVHQDNQTNTTLLTNSGGALYKVNTVLAYITQGSSVYLRLHNETTVNTIAYHYSGNTSTDAGMVTLIDRDTPIYMPEGYSLSFGIGGSFSISQLDNNHVTVSYEIIS